MSIEQKHIFDLVVALLSVNNLRLEVVWDKRKNLERHGLLDAEKVVNWQCDELVVLMKQADYDRGKLTEIIAPRLKALMERIVAGDLDDLPRLVEGGLPGGRPGPGREVDPRPVGAQLVYGRARGSLAEAGGLL